MLILGHLGIGSRLARPFMGGKLDLGRMLRPNRNQDTPILPLGWVLVGTVLPDLVDKPLYQFFTWWTGLHGQAIGLISGGRTFGHTFLFVLLTMGLGYCLNKKALIALALGIVTHLVMDYGGDWLSSYYYMASWGRLPPDIVDRSADLKGFLWPFAGNEFPVHKYATLSEWLSKFLNPVFIGGELVGLGLLWWDFARRYQTK